MQTKITDKLKKFISTLVCVMMVAGTFPTFALNNSVFAGNGAVYSTETGAVPEIAEDIEGENAESDDLNEKTAKSDNEKLIKSDQTNGEQAVETAVDSQDVQMDGGEDPVFEAANFEQLENIIKTKEENKYTIKLTGNIEVNNAESRDFEENNYALIVKNKKIKITSNSVDDIKTIECTGEGSLLKIEGKNSGITLENVKINGMDEARDNSLIRIENGFLQLGRGAKISHCQSGFSQGGAIYCEDSTVTLKNGGVISDCKAGQNGGAIYSVGDKGVINIEEGGEISNCVGGDRDLGLIVPDDNYYKGPYEQDANYPLVGGGAICCEKGEISMSGGKISNCRADLECLADYEDLNKYGSGGAVLLRGGTMKMTGGEISGCYAYASGGAIGCCRRSKLFLKEGRISGCSVNCYVPPKSPSRRCAMGDAVFLQNGSELYIDPGKFNIIPPERSEEEKSFGWVLNGGSEYPAIYFYSESDVHVQKDSKAVKEAKNFEELKKVVEDIDDGEEIKLTGNIIVNDSCYDGDNEYALNVNNKKIKITSDKKDVVIICETDKGLLKIEGENSVFTLENIKIQEKNALRKNSLIYVNKGYLRLNQGTKIFNCKMDRNKSESKYKDKGKNKNENRNGGAVCCEEGIVNIQGAEISDCEAVDGGAIYCFNGVVKMDQGKISNCKAELGGAICCENGTLDINIAEISDCEATNGGAISCKKTKVTLKGKINISGCNAVYYGGAIYCVEGTMEIDEVEISNCDAKCGGAIYCDNNARVRVFSGKITSCFASVKGNAIYAEKKSTLLLIDKDKNDRLKITLGEKKGEDSDLDKTGGYEGIFLAELVSFKSILNDDDHTVVTRVGDFESLKKAILDVEPKKIIKLDRTIEVDNIYENDYALTATNKKITIMSDKENVEIIYKGKGSLLKIEGKNSRVTLKNIKIDGKGITRKGSLIYTEGDLKLGEKAEICNCYSDSKKGGAIYCEGENYVYIEDGGKISNCHAQNGGAIYCNNAAVHIGKGTISECSARESGGAIYCNNAAAYINKGTISECSAEKSGGAIYCDNAELTIENGTFSKCWAKEKGGAICFAGNQESKIVVSGTISECNAAEKGGAIYCSRGTTKISEGKIFNCSAKDGGAIYCDNAELTIENGTFSKCWAGEKGGAICYDGRRVDIKRGTISECNAAEKGGAIYCDNAKLTIENGTISECNAAEKGGAIYCNNAELILKKATISICEIKGKGIGGAIYCSGGTTEISEGKISNCSAKDGGAIYCDNAKLNLKEATISECWVREKGGAIYCDGRGVGIKRGTIFVCGAEDKGGAIYCNNAELILDEGGTISECWAGEKGGAIYCDGRRVDIKSGTISDCHSNNGGAIYCLENSEVSIDKGKIVKCSAEEKGNAIYVDRASKLLLHEKVRIKLPDDSKGMDSDLNKTGQYTGIWLEEGATFEATSVGDEIKVSSYEELREEIKIAKTGETIKLDRDIETDNGDSLIVSGKKITITSSDKDKPRTVRVNPSSGRLLKIEGKDSGVRLEKVVIDGLDINKNDSLIHVEGYLILGGGSEIRNFLLSGGKGAIHCKGGTVNIEGGKIYNCKAQSNLKAGCGGAIYCDEKATVNIVQGEISYCRAHNGGAIYCTNESKVNINKEGKITGCKIDKNKSKEGGLGGAIHCTKKSKVSISEGGTISDCGVIVSMRRELGDLGGAIYCDDSTVTLEKQGKIFRCSAKCGGAIYCRGKSEVNINGEIFYCEAEKGGAIYCGNKAEVGINAGTISGCMAEKKGNAIYVGQASKLSLIGKVIITLNNKADEKCDSSLLKTKGYKGIWLEDGVILDIRNDGQDDNNNNNNNNNQGGNNEIIGEKVGDLNIQNYYTLNPNPFLQSNLGSQDYLPNPFFHHNVNDNEGEINTDSNQISPYENNENDKGDYDESAEESGNAADNSSDKNNKNDFWATATPWLIGAAILAIGAAVVVAVMKNKKASQA